MQWGGDGADERHVLRWGVMGVIAAGVEVAVC